MKNKKVLLSTVFTGYNYGSSLQAFAGKIFLNNLGLDCKLVARKSLIRGRNIQLWKFIVVLLRSMFISQKGLTTFQKQYRKAMIGNSSEKFLQFEQEYLRPRYLSWHELKREAANSVACFSGSDQIWNSSTLYVDPLYYLRFAPKDKCVALSPSFGRDFIADYNKEKMRKWISDYPYLSVREDSGVKLIKELTGRDAVHLLDPTLIIKRDEWKEILKIEEKSEDYVLAYFLDEPSLLAEKSLKELKDKLKCKIVAIPYKFENMDYCDEMVAAGPKEFVELVTNARVVCTDSFHGTVFALNMHTPFFTFEREYGSANKQSERVLSILRKVDMLDRYQPQNAATEYEHIDFEYSENILNAERKKAYDYINKAINSISESNV